MMGGITTKGPMWIPPLSASIAVLFGCVAACFASEFHASLCTLVGQSYFTWLPAPQPRLGSPDIPIAIFIAFLLYAAMTSQPIDPKPSVTSHAPFLSRPQTEEWKGWMQIVLLVYHYFGIDSLYKPARLIVASYVWLTAYGNTVYFFQSGDVTAQRLLAVATRLCVLPVSLSLCLQQPLMLYYVIPQSLLTLFMTVVFFKFNAGFHRLFHKASPDIIVQVASLISLSLLCFGVWDCGLLQRILSMVPDPVVSLPGLSGLVPFKSGHEWLFRTSLDHFMPVWGCATAVVMSSSQQQLDRIPSKLLVAVIPLALVTLVAWVVSVCPLHKLDFNSLHPFVGVIPITAFIIVRNATPVLRSRYIPVFAWVGRHTLETYLFQHHVFLTSNAKQMLQLLPESLPVANFVVVTCLFMATCSVARIASGAIAKHLMSVMVGLNWRHFLGFAVTIAFGYYGVYNHWPIKRICITLSVILVSLKLSNLLSFRSYRPIIVAFVGCWLFVASLLITQPPLPYQLSSSVIFHQQVSAQKCLSLLSRDVRWTTQNGKVMGIPSRLAATSCHSCLRHKQHAFFGVRSLFVGDSQARNMFRHAVAAVTMETHGQSHTCSLDDVPTLCSDLRTEAYFGHRNFTVIVTEGRQRSVIEFVWAPHLHNVTHVLTQPPSVDVVISSFGSWDVLHAVNVTEADWASFQLMSEALVAVNTTVIVATQPRIVPHRLPSPEKRARLHGASMESVNANLIKFSSQAAVLDLFQLTSTPERALHSYDGVHYTDVEYGGAYNHLAALAACGPHARVDDTSLSQPPKPSMIPVNVHKGLFAAPTTVFLCLCLAAWRRFHP